MNEQLQKFMELQVAYKKLSKELNELLNHTGKYSFIIHRRRIVQLYEKKSACYYELEKVCQLLEQTDGQVKEECFA